jgi:hypothetical protein
LIFNPLDLSDNAMFIHAVSARFARLGWGGCRRSATVRRKRLACEGLEERALLSYCAEWLEPIGGEAEAASGWAVESRVAPADDPGVVQASCSLNGTDAIPPAEGWQSAVFNARDLGTLDFEFHRDVPTVDPGASLVAVDTPRFGLPRAIMATPDWEVLQSGTGVAMILGSGWDHDGTTPLAVILNRSSYLLTFYRGEQFQEQNRVKINKLGYEDLLDGTVPGFRYLIRSAIVHEGLVVIQAERDRLQGSVWIPEGVSFITTQDYGATFQRVPQVGGGLDVPAIAGGVSDGIRRGRSWAFSNAFPEKSLDDMLGAWFPWADYLYKTGFPKGGQIGLFRVRRPAVGAPWVVEPNKVVYERWQFEDSGGHHAHSAGMFVDGMASMWGDVGYRNMMVRHVASDLENYTADVWTHYEEFQGAWSPDDAKLYIYGNQAASTAPGPEFGEFITTADEQPEVVMKIQRPDEITQKAIVTNLKGTCLGCYSGSGFEGRLSLSVHRLRGRGYVVTETNKPDMDGLTTIHFSVDGETWASMTTVSNGLAKLYGNMILQPSGGTIFAAPLPADVWTIRPLVVHPGGTNLSDSLWDQVSAPGEGWTYRRVTIEDGLFRYVDDGSWVDPQPGSLPPVMAGMPIWEVSTGGTIDSGGIRSLSSLPSDPASDHWLTMWHYSLDGDGIEPTFSYGVPGPGNQTSRRATRWVANQQWVPSFSYGAPDSDASVLSTSQLWVFSGLTSETAAPRRWLMAGEGFVEGDSATYPLAPGAQGSNELASIEGLAPGTEWTIAIVFGLPPVSAFSSHFEPAGPGASRPIATLLQDSTHRIEINFRYADRTLSITQYADDVLAGQLTFADVFLDREDKVNLVLSSSESEFGATLQVMRNSEPVTHQVQPSTAAIDIRRILFSNGDQAVVSPLEWYAVQVNKHAALTTSQRDEFIATDKMFRVLDAGDRTGDMDLDGNVDFDDIDEFVFALVDPVAYEQAMLVEPSVQGDTDGDGDLDFDDIPGFVGVLNEFPSAQLVHEPVDSVVDAGIAGLLDQDRQILASSGPAGATSAGRTLPGSGIFSPVVPASPPSHLGLPNRHDVSPASANESLPGTSAHDVGRPLGDRAKRTAEPPKAVSGTRTEQDKPGDPSRNPLAETTWIHEAVAKLDV